MLLLEQLTWTKKNITFCTVNTCTVNYPHLSLIKTTDRKKKEKHRSVVPAVTKQETSKQSIRCVIKLLIFPQKHNNNASPMSHDIYEDKIFFMKVLHKK